MLSIYIMYHLLFFAKYYNYKNKKRYNFKHIHHHWRLTIDYAWRIIQIKLIQYSSSIKYTHYYNIFSMDVYTGLFCQFCIRIWYRTRIFGLRKRFSETSRCFTDIEFKYDIQYQFKLSEFQWTTNASYISSLL